MSTPDIYRVPVRQINSGLLGSEGPVFDDQLFYMVAPEKEENGQPAGEILRVDIANGEVSRTRLTSIVSKSLSIC